MGVALVIAVEILGVRSLAFATGSYLPLGTTAAMFAGGLVRSLVDATTKKKDESEASPGALYSSGLIAAGGVFGLLGIIINLFQDPEISTHVPPGSSRSSASPGIPTPSPSAPDSSAPGPPTTPSAYSCSSSWPQASSTSPAKNSTNLACSRSCRGAALLRPKPARCSPHLNPFFLFRPLITTNWSAHPRPVIPTEASPRLFFRVRVLANAWARAEEGSWLDSSAIKNRCDSAPHHPHFPTPSSINSHSSPYLNQPLTLLFSKPPTVP